MSNHTPSLIQQLVQQLGSTDGMLKLMHEDCCYTLMADGTEFGGKREGKSAIRELLDGVFGPVYVPNSFEIKERSLIEQGDHASMRVQLTCQLIVGVPYTNEYAFFIRSKDGLISEVWEYVDGFSATEQMSRAFSAEGELS